MGFTQKVRNIITALCLSLGNRDKKLERPRPEVGYKEREKTKKQAWQKQPNFLDITILLRACPVPFTQSQKQTNKKTEAKSVSYPKGHTHLSGN